MPYKINTLYDPGTAEPLEDKFVEAPPFFAVFDGVSGAYHPGSGWRSFGGKSGGQQVVGFAQKEMKAAATTDSAEAVLRRINERVRAFCQSEGLARPEDLPGTTFALAKVDGGTVELVQGGDTYAVWQLSDGRVGATPNQNYGYESPLLKVVEGLMDKHQGDRKAMWGDYLPIFTESKKLANKPKGYVVLNGDRAGEALWFKKTFAPGELRLLLLVTDGLVAFEETKDEHAMAHLLLNAYAQGGVDALLARVRKAGDNEAKSHIRHAEATALAIEFT